MGYHVTVSTSGFLTMARELSRLSGRDFATVVRSEAASAIKIAALQGRVASAAAIARQTEERTHTWSVRRSRYLHHDDESVTDTGFAVHVNNTRDVGRVWFARDDWSDPKYMIFEAGPGRGWHVPDGVWHEYKLTAAARAEYVKKRIAELQKRRGIERLSWLQMGDALGVSLASVAPSGNLQEEIVRAATVRGRVFQNGTATETTSGRDWSLTVQNDSPVAVRRDGQARLDRANARRERNFQIAAEKGLLTDLQRRATRWPGIFVKAS